MNTIDIIIAISILGGLGLIISIILSVFGNVFKVEENEAEKAILSELPGNNCGGCGYPGCANLAKAIADGSTKANACPVGGKAVADKISLLTGKEAGDSKRMVAFVKCAGTCDKTGYSYDYAGVYDCRMAADVTGAGPKACSYGCLGYGTCVKACQFGAIRVVDGVAYVDREKCTSCGMCVKACPKKLIELIPYEPCFVVACSSKDKGPDLMKACMAGCVACGICAKNCPSGAITVSDNIAYIDQNKCTHCGTCYDKCPRGIIIPV